MLIVLWLLLVRDFIVGEANVLPRIVNGKLADQRQFPYAVQVEAGNNRTVLCGGSIIANDWVLTAGHCTENATWVTLYYGSVWTKHYPLMTLEAKTHVFQHPQFRSVSGDIINDIALIRTEWVEFSDRIQSIALPTEPKYGYNNYVGQWATVAGWGQLHDHGSGSVRLFWATLKVLDVSVCRRRYGNKLVGLLCAQSGDAQSTCYGDSGGPLVLNGENKLIGVFAFLSYLGCEVGDPVGFSDVSRYLGWIRSVSGIGNN
ncbi:serine protease 3-like [Drosophila pseudoobscura]|uniref:Serine protease 3-like n=1 Tax=Drosophila pseudoobscura pseudoobscura TaxID=46245 RepID=A0A6I8V0X3_DROPS|nr:serine protease 3 [Drosophila pseudoobscura]